MKQTKPSTNTVESKCKCTIDTSKYGHENYCFLSENYKHDDTNTVTENSECRCCDVNHVFTPENIGHPNQFIKVCDECFGIGKGHKITLDNQTTPPEINTVTTERTQECKLGTFAMTKSNITI